MNNLAKVQGVRLCILYIYVYIYIYIHLYIYIMYVYIDIYMCVYLSSVLYRRHYFSLTPRRRLSNPPLRHAALRVYCCHLFACLAVWYRFIRRWSQDYHKHLQSPAFIYLTCSLHAGAALVAMVSINQAGDCKEWLGRQLLTPLTDGTKKTWKHLQLHAEVSHFHFEPPLVAIVLGGVKRIT